MSMIIKRNGKVVDVAEDNPNYKPTFESEKNKPNTLFTNTTKEERGLTND
jgi:hypothetical protein